MALIAIIPAKASSTRVPQKNYREFHNGRSLVELTILKLYAAGIPLRHIYVSCEDADVVLPVCKRHGVQFVRRAESLCGNDVPIPDFIRGVVREADAYRECKQRPTDDVLWAQVCDPLFNEYAPFIANWQRWGRDFDSSVVVYRRRKYLLDAEHRPIGFGFGSWHVKSQRLPIHYELGFTASILTRQSIERVGYYVGASPLWYEATNPTIDIDTPEDFQFARELYALRAA